MACWSCQAAGSAHDRCPSCGALQPAPAGEDLFAVLGVPRGFAQDPAELERRFRDRARAFHPDRFARASGRERRIALERSARVNEAHRRLGSPRQRAAYLLEVLAAGDEPQLCRPDVSEARAVHDPELLEEQLAVRERIEVARAAGDAEELSRLADGLSGRLAAIDGGLGELLVGAAPPPEARRAASRLLGEARLLERALEAARG